MKKAGLLIDRDNPPVGNRYQILGNLTVEGADGAAVSVNGRNGEVLALLLASQGQSLSAGRVIDEIWGDDLPKEPETALYTVISRLRNVVGDDLITTSAGYSIDPGSLDAAEFEALLTEAKAKSDLAKYEQAHAMWRGEPLASFENLPTVALETERLTQLRKRGLREWLTLLADSDPGTAADHLKTEVDADLYDEETLGLYMKALYFSGRKPEALKAFRDYEAKLAEETGLEPSARIRELELAILVDELEVPEAPSRQPVALDLEIQYVKTPAGRRLATGRTGSGPRMVVHPGWLSRLDVIASGMDFRTPFWSDLADRVELVLFDRWGTGLSQAEPDDLSLQASVDELIEVLEIVGEGPVPVWGASGAGPIAIQAASQRPDLISHLVLLGTFASGPKTFPEPVRRSMSSLVRASWGMGSQVLASLIFPGGSAEMRSGLADFQRQAASPEVAAALLDQLYEADASDLLDDLEVPALVIHYSQDRAVPANAGEELARSIPSSRYLPLEGLTHYPHPKDHARIVEAIVDFITTP